MRKYLLFGLVVATGICFLSRLYFLQIHQTDTYDINKDNAVKKIFQYPKRGHIYDRNGKLLVANKPSYDIVIIPREVTPFDTVSFCKLLKISKKQFDKNFKRAVRYSPRLPSVFVAHLTKEDYAYFSEKIKQFNGFYAQKRAVRDYQTNIGANVLGYIAEINQNDLNKDPYYRLGDLKGKQGVETSYEMELRGIKGVKYIQKDRYNREIGPYKNGNYDSIPIPGKNITISIDSELQAYGEKLMENKMGGIVAIEPSSGEILCLVSAPSYNPGLLVGRKRSENYTKLYLDTIHRPLVDKGLTRMHPPGSPFKTLVALAALEEEVLSPKENIFCSGAYVYGKKKRRMLCHCGGGYRNMYNAISLSCNSYFANAFRKTINKYTNMDESMDKWSGHMKSFGLGNFLGNDLSVGKKGIMPDGSFYNKWYPDFNWGPTTIISNAIGQGEILVTPIQLANMTAAIANRGYYYTPHIIKSIEDSHIKNDFVSVKQTSINPEHFEPVIEGMSKVFESGTASFLKVPGVEICGKTGTAENFIKIKGEKTQLTDHSIFVAFAPKENPKIALAVLVENGGYGSIWAGRISSLIIEKYLKGTVSLKRMEQLVLSKSLEDEYLKPYMDQPFKINQP